MISIIVPIYNVERFLPRCIDSLINQTYRDMEIILVDDGSTDNCPSIVDEYAKKDDRIVSIHQANGGLSAARNTGLDCAKGEFILFVDSDDFVSEYYVEKLVTAQKANDADIVICNYICVDENRAEIHNDNYTYYARDDIFDGIEGLRLFENRSYRTFFDVVWNKLYRKSLFAELRFPEGISVIEDISVAPVLYHRAEKISVIKDKLYFYTFRSDSLAHTKRTVEEDVRLREPMMEDRLSLYKDWKVKELTLSHIIHMYSMYSKLGTSLRERLKSLQKEYRKEYVKDKYLREVAGSRKFKFLIAFFSLHLYNKLVDLR